ncbi:tyrosine-protein phosphatase [Streptomyces gardneri]|uniref:tyrosine-protein phosphatase n=1 Tax=Nocardia sputi TaxID=2943705 RepID=UPI0018941DCC|nr:tyrosine-protein phosphatase [Nocardia sputi]MBF6168788.1 tyrosine-protein phosphatase [Streptomyces gardneri]MBF6204020.1 tyrosine-protein phosphatase [Streptomyces gardneri]
MPTDTAGESTVPDNRWVEFAQIDNVRDLGGLPVRGGGTTRFGVVYRSSTPQNLTESDLAKLLGPIGLRTLIDLRLPDEVRREGYGLLAGADVRRICLPVRKSPRSSLAARDLVPDASRVDLVDLYDKLLAGSVDSLVAAVRLVVDAGRHSVLFHCAAGKDRTGVLAAVLLDAVGVPAEAIAADYALTGERMQRVRDRLDALASYAGLPPVSTGILGVEAEVMRRFLANLSARHGGAAEWLLTNGLTTAELARLREVLAAPV